MVDRGTEGGEVKLAPLSRIFPNEAFGYLTITAERPLRDDKSKIVLGTKSKQKGKSQADSALRDTENVPLSEAVEDYFKREVLPQTPAFPPLFAALASRLHAQPFYAGVSYLPQLRLAANHSHLKYAKLG